MSETRSYDKYLQVLVQLTVGKETPWDPSADGMQLLRDRLSGLQLADGYQVTAIKDFKELSAIEALESALKAVEGAFHATLHENCAEQKLLRKSQMIDLLHQARNCIYGSMSHLAMYKIKRVAWDAEVERDKGGKVRDMREDD